MSRRPEETPDADARLQELRKIFHDIQNKLGHITMRGEYYPTEPSYRNVDQMPSEEMIHKYMKLLAEMNLMGQSAVEIRQLLTLLKSRL